MILVTGATGTVGSEVVKQLKPTGAPFKIGVTSPEKIAKAKTDGVDAVLLDCTRPETFAPALEAVDTLFVLSPPGRTDLEAPLVDAAKQAGIKHIVKQSALGAEGEDFIFGRGHRASEKHIESSGIPHTFLRPNGFMQNFVNNFAQSIREQGVLYMSQADARISHVDVRDIAAVAAKALTEPSRANRIYTITGPESLSNFDVAAKLSAALGRQIAYVPVTDDDTRKAMKEVGAPAELIEGLVDLMRYYREGKAAVVTNDVERLTGRTPISFDHFARDYASAFTGTAAAD
jgi:uncharacterized protein YbjT (DUF2867 family)